ncbi:hypothetical protein QAD02_002522 [Eretmocerus hayati]|uniref:Uncharacterized protein n=1 Tax=Eretmocerus hayati TaxID=131215 RepID=A0ACC2NK32_9HYME|nr:hypothetical protein QAD02_002522 [Eretmocerus hayati]
MEFPKLGKRCSLEDCQLLDYLPVICRNCSNVFCKNHSGPDRHSCIKASKVTVVHQDDVREFPLFPCSQNLCLTHSPIEILCQHCKKHYCLTHRHHSCSDFTKISYSEIHKKRDESTAFPVQNEDARDRRILQNLEKCKNSVLARKVRNYDPRKLPQRVGEAPMIISTSKVGPQCPIYKLSRRLLTFNISFRIWKISKF